MEQTMFETQMEETITNDLSLNEQTAGAIVGGMRQEDPYNPDEEQGGGGTPSPKPPVPKVTFRPGYGCGGVLLNHNETMAEENEEAETEALADLTIDDVTESAIKGGLLPAVQTVQAVQKDSEARQQRPKFSSKAEEISS